MPGADGAGDEATDAGSTADAGLDVGGATTDPPGGTGSPADDGIGTATEASSVRAAPTSTIRAVLARRARPAIDPW
jgi:hypothetical protein